MLIGLIVILVVVSVPILALVLRMRSGREATPGGSDGKQLRP